MFHTPGAVPLGHPADGIGQQTRIGRMVHVGFHDRGVDPKSATTDNLALPESGRDGPIDGQNAIGPLAVDANTLTWSDAAGYPPPRSGKTSASESYRRLPGSDRGPSNKTA